MILKEQLRKNVANINRSFLLRILDTKFLNHGQQLRGYLCFVFAHSEKLKIVSLFSVFLLLKRRIPFREVFTLRVTHTKILKGNFESNFEPKKGKIAFKDFLKIDEIKNCKLRKSFSIEIQSQ